MSGARRMFEVQACLASVPPGYSWISIGRFPNLARGGFLTIA